MEILFRIAEGDASAENMTILSWGQFPVSSEFKKLACGHLAQNGRHANPHEYSAPVIGFTTIDPRDNAASHDSAIDYAPFPPVHRKEKHMGPPTRDLTNSNFMPPRTYLPEIALTS